MKIMIVAPALLSSALISLPAGQATAAPPALNEPIVTPPTADQPDIQSAGTGHLLGDWAGLRPWLDDKGINFNINYTSEVAANLAGGQRRDITETGQFSFDTNIDTDKAFGWQGGMIHSSISFRRGDNLVQKAGLNTLLQPQEVYGRNQTWHLSELWVRQRTGIFDIAVGRLTLGGDFASLPCEFMNITFCGNQGGTLAGDYWFNYPISQWGARVKAGPGSWYGQIGVYEYNPNNIKKGIALSRSGAQGVTVPAELGWTPHLGRSGLPGLYRVGGWYSTAHANDVLDDRNGDPFGLSGLAAMRHEGRYGGYVMLQQQLTGHFTIDADGPHTTQGLELYINFMQLDRRTQRLDDQVSMMLTFTGPLGMRPKDEIGFAVGRNAVNSRAALATVIANPGTQRPRAEYPVELFYTARLFSWLTVSPDAQYYFNPGGYSRARNLTIVGAKSSVTF